MDNFENTQDRAVNEMLLHLEDFYCDEIGDALINNAYNQYLRQNSLLMNDADDISINEAYDQYLQDLNRNVNNDHDYAINVSEKCL